MREQSRIPKTKVERAVKFASTGAKVGGNYLKYYSKKIVNPKLTKEGLHKDNAEDIYGSLSQLKGSALKVAQMLALDKNILPQAYQQQFAMAQYSAPPLSYPLVVKTFKKYLDKSPSDIFDSFTHSAVNAASIGQVHQAKQGNKTFAVKVQYPGVAESISSDLKIVKPVALRLFNLNEAELDLYLGEVQERLLEETDYNLELGRSQELSRQCSHIPNLKFPEYFKEYSSERILTMEWINGKHPDEYMKTNPSQNERNMIGQALWDFYNYQVHNLLTVHADPHPGNFFITDSKELGVIDFGCVKVIPHDFYFNYFGLLNQHDEVSDKELMDSFYKLKFIFPDESEKEKKLFFGIFKEMIGLLGKPFHQDAFDFGDDDYFNQIYQLSERIQKLEEVRNSKMARGSRHGLYVNRTYFGLYNLLNSLKAKVSTGRIQLKAA